MVLIVVSEIKTWDLLDAASNQRGSEDKNWTEEVK